MVQNYVRVWKLGQEKLVMIEAIVICVLYVDKPE